MSLFRKPKKMQRRVFCADDDDEEEGEPQPPPPPLISKEKKEAKPLKKTLLSFADEEEDGEVFKVKKSKQSSRLAKRREKEKKKPLDDGDSNKYDNNDLDMENKNKSSNNSDKPKKKKVTLEGLILSGREALAADGAGDVSDSPPEEDEEDNRGFHTYRAETVRAALAVAPGHIPDAALIHAARKTRQQARELGDFVPVQSEAAPGSRLVREDDDDDEDGRIQVRGLDLPSDKPKRGTAAAPTNEELDSEPDEWEEQQIKKAMPAIMDINTADNSEACFTMHQTGVAAAGAAHAHLRALARPGQPPLATAAELVAALSERLGELRVEREHTAAHREELRQRLATLARTRAARAARCAELDAAYRHTQELRGYLTDLIECLDEKMPQLEALESRALAMYRRRCEFLMERRRADVRDQAQDVLALAARPGATKPVDSEEKIRRAAEREGRRRARRLARASGVSHRDGDSSDDELPPAEEHHFRNERDSIAAARDALFADALPAWRSARGVAARLARWRRRAPAAYRACVAPALPRLLAPYLRHQLILWNPLADADNEDYERMDWYRCLMMYGVRSERVGSDSEDSVSEDEEPPHITEDSVSEDPDLMLVPTLISKVVLPKVAELVEHAWDPFCVRACIRLRATAARACVVPGAAGAGAGAGAGARGAGGAGGALRRLAAAADARLAAALAADVFLPALPPQIMEGAGGAFWKRCLGAGVRLLRAALCLTGPPAVLHADNVVMALIERLSVAAGAAPGPSMVAACVALVETLPRTGQLRARALERLAALARLALTKIQDNPMHLRAVEQARSVIAEAKLLASE